MWRIGRCTSIYLLITITSLWPRWRLKSPASRLFTQLFIQTQIKESIKAPRHWPLCGEFTGTGEFPAQRASYAENVSIWWRHHVIRLIISRYKIHLSSTAIECILYIKVHTPIDLYSKTKPIKCWISYKLKDWMNLVWKVCNMNSSFVIMTVE